ncbi:radial spoke head protein 4 homolog A [Diachasma alloeum]|uniref:radial spoke head protein 4 homolog A n=1 Tax=Diachasma alloeum TaxID=454923 RepID=UPI0007384D6A|nr:radial spoke head protein 4 homolog A [Diachasma alloeum]
MAYSYDIDEAPVPKLPSIQHDVQRGKMFLMKHSSESGDCLYDHLSELLGKILSERPKNAVDLFERYSKELKEERLRIKSNLHDLYLPPAEYSEAEKLIKLFQIVRQEDENHVNEVDDGDESETERIPPDLMDLFYYLEQIDVGFPKSEVVLLNLSIRMLMREHPIVNVRFWGKILGKPLNYNVVEAELTQEEVSRRRLQVSTGNEGDEEEVKTINERDERDVEDSGANVSREDYGDERSTLESAFSVLEGSDEKLFIPSEVIGTGVNKKVYFVCNSPGYDCWVELPPVTPEQIIISRKILRHFTGCLETPIHTFPAFPGNEKNYLRAQIARITATTSVSPIGYFTFGKGEEQNGEEEEEEEEEEDENGGDISVNSHYDPLPTKELTDPSLSNWCHHVDYILEQGRTVWWNSESEEQPEEETEAEEEESDEDEDEEGEGENEGKGIKKEIGPSLLTPLSEDILIDTIPPWTARLSSKIQQDTAIAIVRSNLWPGAVGFAKDKKFGNFYVGTGHKFATRSYAPPVMPAVEEHYKLGPEIMEMMEPSFEAEEAYRIAHLPPTKISDADEQEEEEDDEEGEKEQEEDVDEDSLNN